MNTPPGIESRQSTAGIDFYLTSQGNHFMTEIAQMFREGFEKLGLEASLRFDEVPGEDTPWNRLQVLVAPHELIPLFLARKLNRKELRTAIAGCFLLNTEQPGSTWFETAFKFAANARGVFDINQQGVREFQRRGVPTLHTPLGYAPRWSSSPPASRAATPRRTSTKARTSTLSSWVTTRPGEPRFWPDIPMR